MLSRRAGLTASAALSCLQQNTTASLLEIYFNDSMQTVYARAAAAVAVNKERSPMGPM